MKVFWTDKASREFADLPREVQKRIAKKMRMWADHPDPLRFAKRLANSQEGEFRFRIGDYRIIFDIQRNTLFVLKVAKRDDVYE